MDRSMSGASHDQQHQRHLSGDFQFHDELASLFAQAQRPDAATMQLTQPWFFADYLQQAAGAATPMLDDYDAFARVDDDFDVPAADEEVIKWELQAIDDGTAGRVGIGMPGGGPGGTAPLTPNSVSVSSTSSEAGGRGGGGTGAGAGGDVEESAGKCKKEEGEADESNKAGGDGEEDKKGEAGKGKGKGKGKGEKRPRQARFAFMTKSEVDHLEDGYRWRKYGQKAVKNSPFPRSYYRCTTQKCPVKKRVERSHQDAAVVITTYEDKHTHPIPATLRGTAHLLAAHAHAHAHGALHHHYPAHFRMPAAPAPLPPTGAFRPGAAAMDVLGFLQLQQGGQHHATMQAVQQQQLAAGTTTTTHQVNAGAMADHGLPGMTGTATTSSAATAANSVASTPLQMQHFMAQDYGLLQDMLPCFIHNDDTTTTNNNNNR